MDAGLTLNECLVRYSEKRPHGLALAAGIDAIATASISVSRLIARGSLAGLSGLATGRNADGDVQKDLDVRADEIMREELKLVPVAAIASEEAEQAEILDPGAPICVAIDPLDGSSNIDTNVSVGTIFSILSTPSDIGTAFSRDGSHQLAAGFVVYGPQTSLVLTIGEGVDVFILDPSDHSYKLVRKNVRIPSATTEYAINASNYRHWEAPVRSYVDACLLGSEGACPDFNMRWIGSLVAEAYRVLTRGGVFLYPADGRDGYGEGRLRLLYEAHPMAFIMEQAGGAATTGRARILDLAPRTLHQRVPLIMGSIDEVRVLDRLHADAKEKELASPLFARRGLFRSEAR